MVFNASDKRDRRRRARARIEAVQAVLRRWDPIGILPGKAGPADEYDSYAPHIVTLVSEGASVGKVAAHLGKLRIGAIGLGPDPHRDAEVAAEIIEVLRTIVHLESQATEFKGSAREAMTQRAKPGEVTIAFEYRRHLGPRFMHGSVTLQFSTGAEFVFQTHAIWPANDDYTSAVERAIRDVLAEQGVLKQTTCTLQSVGWDEHNSCEAGFAAAARAATLAAFEV
jgi:hypothetical protein